MQALLRWVKFVTPAHALVSLVLLSACWVFWGFEATVAVGVGSLIELVNLWVLGWVWAQLLLKKMFALPIAVIVIKYPLLMFVLWELIVGRRVHVGGLSVGLGSILGTSVVLAVGHQIGWLPALSAVIGPVVYRDIAKPEVTTQGQSDEVDTRWVDHSERL